MVPAQVPSHESNRVIWFRTMLLLLEGEITADKAGPFSCNKVGNNTHFQHKNISPRHEWFFFVFAHFMRSAGSSFFCSYVQLLVFRPVLVRLSVTSFVGASVISPHQLLWRSLSVRQWFMMCISFLVHDCTVSHTGLSLFHDNTPGANSCEGLPKIVPRHRPRGRRIDYLFHLFSFLM